MLGLDTRVQEFLNYGFQFDIVIVSASRPPPRPLDAQRFFGGAVLGYFLALYFRDAFLACLGCFLGLLRTLWESLGPPTGALWASLGDLGVSLGPSWPCWASLGLLFWLIQCSFGLSWAAPGRPFSTFLAQEAARQRQGAPRQPQKSPKRPPREPKWYPKSASFVSFLGSFVELSSGLLFGRVLGRLAP